MFENHVEKKSWSIPAKMVTVSAVCLLLSFGLCAVGGGLMAQPGSTFTAFVNNAGILLFFVSLLGLVIGFIAWFIYGISRMG